MLPRSIRSAFSEICNFIPPEDPNDSEHNIFYRETSDGNKIAFRRPIKPASLINSEPLCGASNIHSVQDGKSQNNLIPETISSNEGIDTAILGVCNHDSPNATQNLQKFCANGEKSRECDPPHNSESQGCDASYRPNPSPINLSISVPSLGSYRWSPIPSTRFSSPTRSAESSLSKFRRAKKLVSRSSSGILTTMSRSPRHRNKRRYYPGWRKCTDCRGSLHRCEYCSSLWISKNVKVLPTSGDFRSAVPPISWVRKVVRSFLPLANKTLDRESDSKEVRHIRKHNEISTIGLHDVEYTMLDGQPPGAYSDTQDVSPSSLAAGSQERHHKTNHSSMDSFDTMFQLRRPLSNALSLPVIRETPSFSFEEPENNDRDSGMYNKYRCLFNLSSSRRKLKADDRGFDTKASSMFRSTRTVPRRASDSMETYRQDLPGKLQQRYFQPRGGTDCFDSHLPLSTDIEPHQGISKQRRSKASAFKRITNYRSMPPRHWRQDNQAKGSISLTRQSHVVPRRSHFREELDEVRWLAPISKQTKGSTIRRRTRPYEGNSLDGSSDGNITQRKRNQGSVFTPEGGEDASAIWERALLNHTTQTSKEHPAQTSIEHDKRNMVPGSIKTSTAPKRPKFLPGISLASSMKSTSFTSLVTSATMEFRGDCSIAKKALREPSRSWERYPSHTKAERTSTGIADGIVVRDYSASAAADSNNRQPANRFPLSSASFWKRAATLYKNNINDLRRLGRGHRSSLSAGGTVAYPDLELLPKMTPAYVKPNKKIDNNGEGPKNAQRWVSNEEPPGSPVASRGDESPESPGQVTRSSAPRTAMAWSMIYEDCVQNPYNQRVQGSDASFVGIDRQLDRSSLPCSSTSLYAQTTNSLFLTSASSKA